MFTGIQLMMVTTTTLLVGTGMTKYQAIRVSIGLGATKALVMLGVAVFMKIPCGGSRAYRGPSGICEELHKINNSSTFVYDSDQYFPHI